MSSQHYSAEAFVPEHHIFWMLVRRNRFPSVGHVYLAIQAAIGLQMPYVDVGRLIGYMMPEDRGTMSSYCPNIGNEGLAYFSWLYETELTNRGGTDYHHYLFKRRYDGASVTAYLKTSNDVGTPTALERQEKMRRKLEKQRDAIMVKHRWATTKELVQQVFPDALVLELSESEPLNSKVQRQIQRGRLEQKKKALEAHLRKIRAELKMLPPAP